MNEFVSASSSTFRTSNSIDVRRPETFVLAWLTKEIGNDIYKVVTQLRRTVNEVRLFNVLADYLEYVNSIHHERVILVLSTSKSWKDVLPIVHDLPQVDSIYMLDALHGTSHTYRKLRDSKNISKMNLHELIRNDCAKAERQLVNFEAIGKSQTGDVKSEEQDKQEASFMYGLLLKETLLKMDDGDEHELVEFCRPQYRDNHAALSVMDELKYLYSAHSPVAWYTRNSFLYGMLNKALREQHVETIYAFRFFIRQLHMQLVALTDTLGVQILYRGVRISNDQFESIRLKVGGLLSFTSFLSTSTEENAARMFAGYPQQDLTTTPMLMIMKVTEPIPVNVALADITGESHFGDESEWLFSLGTIFRIDSIEKEDNIDGIWLVHLTLTSDEDAQLAVLTEHFRSAINDIKPLIQLGRLVYEMGNTKDAEIFYKKALESETEWEGRSLILSNLGAIYDDFDNFDQALMYYHQSLEIEKEHRSDRHPAFGPTYNNMGIIFWKKKQFEDALSSFQLAIDNELAASAPNQEMIANSYNNIGTVLFSAGRHEESLSAKLKAYDIKVKILPVMHPSIAISCENIAKSLYKLNRVREALDYMKMATDIDRRSLPSGHAQTTEHQNILADYTSKLNAGTL